MFLLSEDLRRQNEIVSSSSSSSSSNDAVEEKEENASVTTLTSSGRHTSLISSNVQRSCLSDSIFSKSMNTETNNNRTAVGVNDMTGQMASRSNTSVQNGGEKRGATTPNSTHPHRTTETLQSFHSKRKKQTQERAEDDVEGGSAKKKTKKKKTIASDEEEDVNEDDAQAAFLQLQSLTQSEEKTLKEQTEARRRHNINNPDAHSVREAMFEMKSRCLFCRTETCTKYCAAACSAIYDAVDKDPVGKNREGAPFWCHVCSLTKNEEKSRQFCKDLDKKAGNKLLGTAAYHDGDVFLQSCVHKLSWFAYVICCDVQCLYLYGCPCVRMRGYTLACVYTCFCLVCAVEICLGEEHVFLQV